MRVECVWEDDRIETERAAALPGYSSFSGAV